MAGKNETPELVIHFSTWDDNAYCGAERHGPDEGLNITDNIKLVTCPACSDILLEELITARTAAHKRGAWPCFEWSQHLLENYLMDAEDAKRTCGECDWCERGRGCKYPVEGVDGVHLPALNLAGGRVIGHPDSYACSCFSERVRAAGMDKPEEESHGQGEEQEEQVPGEAGER